MPGREGARGDVVFAYAECGGKSRHSCGCERCGIFFFSEIFQDDRLQRIVGAAGEHAQMLRKRLDVTVVLRGVELQRFA